MENDVVSESIQVQLKKGVLEMCVLALESDLADRKTIAFGGPEALSVMQAIAVFQATGAKPFQLEYVPMEVLTKQFTEAVDSMQKTFAALMLGFAYGDAMAVDPVVEALGIKLTSVAEYARQVL